MKKVKTERWPNGHTKDPVFNKETLATIGKAKTDPIPTVTKTRKFRQAGADLKEAMRVAHAERRKRALKYLLYGESEI